MSACSDPGATHHTGCECWEEKRKAEVRRAYTDGARAMKAEMLQAALRLTYDGELWPELILRLRDASVEKGNE